MLVKQKEANRQSMILLQSTEPSVQLLKALEDVATVTKTLEVERLQHQQKVGNKPVTQLQLAVRWRMVVLQLRRPSDRKLKPYLTLTFKGEVMVSGLPTGGWLQYHS